MFLRPYARRWLTWCYCCLLLLGLWSCSKQDKHEVVRSFYYWKTVFKLTSTERQQLQDLHVQKLYVRYFDVKWDAQRQMAYPAAPLVFSSSLENLPEVVPTVYITNKALQELPTSKVPELAQNIVQKINRINLRGKLKTYREIQLDCDWTESTQSKYFMLLRQIKKGLASNQVLLSATIRLHQVKFARRTGVPPVDKGMLMFYNMGKLTDEKGGNSIYEEQLAGLYLHNFKEYPLALDVALPAFSWAVVIRKGKTIGLLRNLRKQDFSATADYDSQPNNRFLVKRIKFIQKLYLHPNDIIRLEEINPELTLQAARQVKPHLSNDTLAVALYHFDQNALKPYTHEDLEKAFDTFR